jgi:hypothetical protein
VCASKVASRRSRWSPRSRRAAPHGLWDERYKDQPVETMPWFYADLDADLAQALDRLGIGSGKALDLGTGPGTQAIALAKRGLDVTSSWREEGSGLCKRCASRWATSPLLRSTMHNPPALAARPAPLSTRPRSGDSRFLRGEAFIMEAGLSPLRAAPGLWPARCSSGGRAVRKTNPAQLGTRNLSWRAESAYNEDPLP